jgi:hypothetical protein
MGLRYLSLDQAVRGHMRGEFERDRGEDSLYISRRFTEAGREAWIRLLPEAIDRHDDGWLSGELARGWYEYFHETEVRSRRRGGYSEARVPRTAPVTFAEGEFNRFYARGVCRDVLASGGSEVVVYRGKLVERPRRISIRMEGEHLDAAALLDDLRTSKGVEPALRLPPGPNSGVTIARPSDYEEALSSRATPWGAGY